MIPPSLARTASFLLVVLTASAPDVDAQRARPKNVLLLYSDDAGWADFGFQPHAATDVKTLTPRIDSIATQGARFTNAYMSGCVCSPSRAGLITGRYQQRFGHERNIPPNYMEGGLDLEQRTIGDRLHALGLVTGLVGKWHLGYPEAHQPNQRGFDWFHGLLQGSRGYHPIENVSRHRVIQENGRPLPEVGYVTDRFGDAAVRFLEEHREEPYFLFVSFTATHGPLQPTDEDLERVPEDGQPRRRKNLGLLVGLDRAVGKILDALDRLSLTENTLVVFTNDNGGQTQTGASNGPLRGHKGQLWEGGVRVPLAMRWPGVLEPGTTIDDPVIALDLLPTFVAAVGGTIEPAWKLDGIDLTPRLRGEIDALPERSLLWRSQGNEGPIAIRKGRHKLVHPRGEEDAAPMLYDLDADLGETTDLAAEHPDVVSELLAELEAWERQLEEPRWGSGERRRRK